jgi:hypothetical protein
MTPRVDRLKALLRLDELESVREWCKRQGVPAEEWPEHRAAGAWLDLAIGRAVDVALRTGRARSYTAALRFICGDVGLDAESVRRRWHRRRAA